ncbi:MAG: ketoacyl-ACP synthase III [Melioribacteraceae bacterium]|nr:ketoacyl-ACP synthase III [Candidatus Cloacimonadota bacterium]MCF8241081.1 ketoacyl-ACP synthase III [Melioribacteraceae bacterium]MCF8354506.1 ketoacyl-ACP synthase III [Melioribacteraceae bacterium]MCF8394275.1 ketoacyl-ACP synthase III [Melioribacteraceae bacterium]MCF8418175.1 ketoacyl-ACP synthase III [Melioribacteraceae bacterium]
MRNAVIKSVGAYAPERVIPNSYFNELLGEDVDTWLRTNLTIKERRWSSEEQAASDLAVEAAKIALKRADLKPEDIDLLIVTTDTPDYISPSTASVVQDKLNALHAGTFDINSACAGFVTGIDTAAKFIKADDNYNNILVIGTYAMSKYLDLTDKKTVTLFADGAGALILSAENSKSGFVESKLHSEGQYNDWMGIYGGGTRNPLTPQKVAAKDHLLKFVKKFPKEINPTTWTNMISGVIEKHDLNPNNIDHYFFTQININSIWETMDNLKVDKSKAHTIMDRYGYTGSACIPMALNDAFEKGKISKGDKLIFMGSGGGLAFACALFQW